MGIRTGRAGDQAMVKLDPPLKNAGIAFWSKLLLPRQLTFFFTCPFLDAVFARMLLLNDTRVFQIETRYIRGIEV